MVAQLWADPSAINDQNIGALRSATKRINRGLDRLDQTIESKLEDAEFYVGDEFSNATETNGSAQSLVTLLEARRLF